jgi:hypothetical protein
VLIATAIHWFNPIVYLIARAIEAQCELSCDAEVVRNTDADMRQSYSETIIGVVKYQSRLKTALSTNFYGGKKGMKNRISSIMDTGKKKAGISIICAVLIVSLGTGFVFAANADNSADKKELTASTNSNIVLIGGDGTVKRNADGETFLVNADGTGKRSDNGGKTWEAFVYEAPDFETYSVAEYEQYVKDFKAAAPDLVASGVYTQAEVDSEIAYMERVLALTKMNDGEGIYIVNKTIDGTDENGDKAIRIMDDISNAEVFSEYSEVLLYNDDGNVVEVTNPFTANGSGSTDFRLPTDEIFAEYKEWGLSIEGLYPNPDGGFTANEKQNVFLHGRLIRGFSDFDNGIINISISSADRGSSEWVQVVRDKDGRITGIDIS